MARITRPAAAVTRRSRSVSEQRQGQQLVVAVQQVGDAADADRHAAADQLGVDLGDAAVLGVAEAADQGDDVEAELVLRAGRSGPPARAGGGTPWRGQSGSRQRRTWSRSRTMPSRVVTVRWVL